MAARASSFSQPLEPHRGERLGGSRRARPPPAATRRPASRLSCQCGPERSPAGPRRPAPAPNAARPARTRPPRRPAFPRHRAPRARPSRSTTTSGLPARGDAQQSAAGGAPRRSAARWIRSIASGARLMRHQDEARLGLACAHRHEGGEEAVFVDRPGGSCHERRRPCRAPAVGRRPVRAATRASTLSQRGSPVTRMRSRAHAQRARRSASSSLIAPGDRRAPR